VCSGVSVETIAAEAMLAQGRAHVREMPRVETAGTRATGVGSIAELALFERLRALRKRIADEQGVPAYIVFNDAVLRAMAAHRPASAEEMLRVPGVGRAKLERYGEAFLEAIANSAT
jgi:ATP-dependent DNA helicase RecQ